ncbi:MAG: HlyC/CorC family transporter [Opitutales bacterium]|nr:HlyC/CorC family transporter [Opitutales bacterium]
MSALIAAIVATLGISALCSLLEAVLLSTSVADIESLRKKSERRAHMLEKFRDGLDMTSSAILTLNTVANTLGATVVGLLASREFAHRPEMHFMLWAVPALMVVGILVFSEIFPKNFGVAYRRQLHPYIVYPMALVRWSMWPVALLARYTIRALLPSEEKKKKDEEESDEEEILLLADKQAKEGVLSTSERDMIANALRLDDVHVSEIMTPRTVVTFVEASESVGEVSQRYKAIPFARIPVFHDSIDNVVGLVRRRDIMQAYSEDRDSTPMNAMMVPIPVVPETASGLDALQLFLKEHQQLALVVDEFGSTAGVVTMEDVIEQLLGREIYEETDLAIDMRELAMRRARRWAENAQKRERKDTRDAAAQDGAAPRSDRSEG